MSNGQRSEVSRGPDYRGYSSTGGGGSRPLLHSGAGDVSLTGETRPLQHLYTPTRTHTGDTGRGNTKETVTQPERHTHTHEWTQTHTHTHTTKSTLPVDNELSRFIGDEAGLNCGSGYYLLICSTLLGHPEMGM